MYPILPGPLDNLAAAGVIDFDADSYVTGKAPRYAGAPKTYLPFEQPLPYRGEQYGVGNQHGESPKLREQPQIDAYISKNENKEPAWKKYALGGIIAGLTILGLSKLKSAKSSSTPIKDFFMSPITCIKNKFKKAPSVDAASQASAEAGAAAKKTINAKPVVEVEKKPSKIKGFYNTVKNKIDSVAKTLKIKKIYTGTKNKIKSMPKWAKVTGGIVAGITAGLVGLIVLARIFLRPSAQPVMMQPSVNGLQMAESAVGEPVIAKPVLAESANAGPAEAVGNVVEPAKMVVQPPNA